MNKAYLLMGGNVGDTKQIFLTAIVLLESECGIVSKKSSLYDTAPWGKADQQNFLNQALLLDTPLSAHDLLRNILYIEEKMGRRRLEKNGPRVIDIDILLYNELIIDDVQLSIPHPELQFRRFALTPLAEIAPSYIHPILHKSVAQLLLECGDQLEVAIVE